MQGLSSLAADCALLAAGHARVPVRGVLAAFFLAAGCGVVLSKRPSRQIEA